jgi:O-antigen/teichoic acid export membrane protein
MLKNRVTKNIFSLTLSEIATKVITFLMTAYLARTLGVAGYGMMANVMAIIAFVLSLVNLGFNVLGMRSIAKDIENKEKYVNNITSIKLALGSLGYIVVVILVILNGNNTLYNAAMLIGGSQLILTAFNIDWFYQGIERMDMIGLRNITVSIVTLIGVLVFVKDANDVPLYIAMISISQLLTNGWIIKYYTKHFAKIKLVFDWQEWKKLLSQSLPLGFMVIITAVFTSFNIFYLSEHYGDAETGLFSSAFKLFAICQIPVTIILNAFAPRFAKVNITKEKADVISRSFKMTLLVGTFITTFVFINAELIIRIVFGDGFIAAGNILKILMVGLFLGFVHLNYSMLLNLWNKEKNVMCCFIVAAVLNVILNVILIDAFSARGAAFASLTTEFALLIMLSHFMRKEIHHLQYRVILSYMIISIIVISLRYLIILIGNTFGVTINPIPLSIAHNVLGLALYIFGVFTLGLLNIEDLKKLK